MEEGIDALYDLIWHIESYEQVRHSLLARPALPPLESLASLRYPRDRHALAELLELLMGAAPRYRYIHFRARESGARHLWWTLLVVACLSAPSDERSRMAG